MSGGRGLGQVHDRADPGAGHVAVVARRSPSPEMHVSARHDAEMSPGARMPWASEVKLAANSAAHSRRRGVLYAARRPMAGGASQAAMIDRRGRKTSMPLAKTQTVGVRPRPAEINTTSSRRDPSAEGRPTPRPPRPRSPPLTAGTSRWGGAWDLLVSV